MGTEINFQNQKDQKSQFHYKMNKKLDKTRDICDNKDMNNEINEYFENVELYEEYDGYFCSVPDVITITRVIFEN